MSQPEPTERRPRNVPPPLVAVAGWLVPGAGYWLVGERGRGTVVLVVVVSLYTFGLLLGGIRVIEVPGYDRDGRPVRLDARGYKVDPDQRRRDYEGGRFALTHGGLLGEIVAKPWFVGEVLAGPISLMSAFYSVKAATEGVAPPHARLAEIGTLYAAIAGMLNLLAMIDSSHRTPVERSEIDEDARDGERNEQARRLNEELEADRGENG